MANWGSFVQGLASGIQQERHFIEQRKNMEMQRDAAAFQAKMLKHQLDKQDQNEALMAQLPPQMRLLMSSDKPLELLLATQMMGGVEGGAPGPGMPPAAPVGVPGGLPQAPQGGNMNQLPSLEQFLAARQAPAAPPPAAMPGPGGPVNLRPIGLPGIDPKFIMRGVVKKALGLDPEGDRQWRQVDYQDPASGRFGKVDKDLSTGAVRPDSFVPERVDEGQGKKFSQEMDLRKEYTEQSKKFLDTRDAFSSLAEFASSDSAAGDVAMIYKFMTTIDPASSVKEGEVAMAKNAQGVPERILNYYNMSVKGTALTPAQREDFLKQARAIYDKQLKSQKQRMSRYRDVAKGYGLDPNLVVTDFTAGTPSGSSSAAAAPVKPDLIYVPGQGFQPAGR